MTRNQIHTAPSSHHTVNQLPSAEAHLHRPCPADSLQKHGAETTLEEELPGQTFIRTRQSTVTPDFPSMHEANNKAIRNTGLAEHDSIPIVRGHAFTNTSSEWKHCVPKSQSDSNQNRSSEASTFQAKGKTNAPVPKSSRRRRKPHSDSAQSSQDSQGVNKKEAGGTRQALQTPAQATNAIAGETAYQESNQLGPTPSTSSPPSSATGGFGINKTSHKPNGAPAQTAPLRRSKRLQLNNCCGRPRHYEGKLHAKSCEKGPTRLPSTVVTSTEAPMITQRKRPRSAVTYVATLEAKRRRSFLGAQNIDGAEQPAAQSMEKPHQPVTTSPGLICRPAVTTSPDPIYGGRR